MVGVPYVNALDTTRIATEINPLKVSEHISFEAALIIHFSLFHQCY